MYFRLATGYLPFAPASTFEWPIVTALMQHVELPDAADQWSAFAASHQVTLALTCDRQHSPALNQMFEEMGVSPLRVGGVTLYRMPPEALAEYRDADATRMEAVEQEQRFGQLLRAVVVLSISASPGPGCSAQKPLPAATANGLRWQRAPPRYSGGKAA